MTKITEYAIIRNFGEMFNLKAFFKFQSHGINLSHLINLPIFKGEGLKFFSSILLLNRLCKFTILILGCLRHSPTHRGGLKDKIAQKFISEHIYAINVKIGVNVCFFSRKTNQS